MEDLTALKSLICLEDNTKEQILIEGKKAADKKRHQQKVRKRILAGFLIVIITIPFSRLLFSSKEGMFVPITVYAQWQGDIKKIDLESQKSFILEKISTPMGKGYSIQVTAEEGYYYELDSEQPSDTINPIFTDKDNAYWIPDYWEYGDFKIYDENGNESDPENLSDASSKPTLNYTVYDETNIVRMKMTIRLSENNGKGIAEIIKVTSYPEKTDEVDL